jgi:hypothetical protein
MDTYDIARFWSRVEVRKQNNCWPWRYGQNHDGYGEFRRNTTNELAHRIAYELSRGDIPADSVVRHSCDNRLCCNPAHLLIGSHADNVADRVHRNRSAKGSTNGRAVLDEEAVSHIRESRLSKRALAAHYDVDERTIDKIQKRETWAHV